MRAVCRERAHHRLWALGRADAIGQVQLQPAFVFRQRLRRGTGHKAQGLGAVVGIGLGWRGFKASGKPGHLEICNLNQHPTLSVGEGNIKSCAVAGGARPQAHMAANLCGQRRPHQDAAIAQRHPKIAALIARRQGDGPAGGQIHQTGVQQAVIILRRRGQAQMGQAFCRGFSGAKGGLLQHLPAGTKIQMCLLRGMQRPVGCGVRHLRAAGLDGGEIQRWRLLAVGQQGDFGLGVERIAPRRKGAVGGKIIACILCLQPQNHRARGRFRDHQGPQKGEVPDLKRRLQVLCRQRLGNPFDIAGAGYQRGAAFGAVLIQHPGLVCVQLAGKDRIAKGVESGLVQQGLGAALALRWGGAALTRGHGFGGHAGIGPDAPVNGDNPGLIALAMGGIGVEIFIGGDIVDLPGGPGDRRGGGKQQHQVKAAIGEQIVEHPQASDLGGQNLGDLRL